jgi:hypothetical protein
VITGALLAERPAGITIGIALCLGLGYALLLLGPAGAFGTAPFWALPTGLIGGALDIRTSLAGYWWFVLADWRWPLFALDNPNWPRGANAELFDIVPVVAILGKLLHSGFAWKVNPYPCWVTFCLVMNAGSLAMLVRALGQRSVLGAVLAGAFGAMAPVVQHRFGHLALMAHWLPVLALALYCYSKPRKFTAGVAAGAVGLCLLASFVHLYLYVMTAAIAAAAVLQAMLDRRLSPLRGGLAMVLLMLAGVAPLWVFGLFEGWNLAGVTGDLGRYSMNLVSPFWPQTSGLFGWTGIYWLTRGSIGATPGQYEGFDYLGAGALLLIVLALPAEIRRLGAVLSRHTALAIAFVVLTAWALSNRIYLGPYLLISYQPPQFLVDTVLSWFRSSGRLFWPVGWFVVGLGIARAPARFRPVPAVAIAVLALLLQWTDVAPWRTAFARLFATPPTSAFGTPEDAMRVARAIEAAGAVVVVPPVFCSSAGADFTSPLNVAAMEVQLMAARANARMPSVYLARVPPDCGKPPELGAAGVVVALKDKGSTAENQMAPNPAACFDVPIARVCSTAGFAPRPP